MSYQEKNIFELLPALYRIRDADQGGPLESLINIIASQANVLRGNIDRLHENWFIETCEDWVVPYIGDLLGVRSLHAITGAAVSQRSYVANTIRYRRRKGMAPVLEQLAMDTTGWRAHVTEFFQLLQSSQHLRHVRPGALLTPDLRQMNSLDLLHTPFSSTSRSAEMRHIESGRGKFNIPNIGLFIWRLQNYPVVRSDAFRSTCVPDSPPASPVMDVKHVFRFSPLGYDMPLFNNPQTETEITHISTEVNVPGPLRRRAAHARPPVFDIFPAGSQTAIPAKEVLICNLERCCTVPASVKSHGVDQPISVAVDPVLGRFMFTDTSVQSALVSYSYGFSGDVGAGSYNRQSSIAGIFHKKTAEDQVTTVDWQAGVSKTETGPDIFGSVHQAVEAWNILGPGKVGIISVMDSRTYPEDLKIIMHEKSRLLIVAARWPGRQVPNGPVGEQERTRGDIGADNLRPHIAGNIVITGMVNSEVIQTDSLGQITLNGLLISASVWILKGCLGVFNLLDSTVVPGSGGLSVAAGTSSLELNDRLEVSLIRSICASVDFTNTPAASFSAVDCIIDNNALTNFSILAEFTPVTLTNTTILGPTYCKTLEADNSIFSDTVSVIRKQTGCIRFSFVAPKFSRTPRKYRCQPDLQINSEIEAAEQIAPLSTVERARINQRVTGWLAPAYTSVDYRDPGYGQLHTQCPAQINAGADNAAEMGAFNMLQQPQRRANLEIALGEYLPFGLSAGIFYTT